MATGQAGGFTIPAHNLRGLTYDKARTLFQVAKHLNAGAFIFEIAKSEMGYTDQRPAEFSACVLAAALAEEWTGPVFIQGDHFQFSVKGHTKNPAAEMEGIQKLTREAVDAGFYNIDIDSSTLVVLERPTLREQQNDNFERCAEMTRFIREIQPPGVTVSIGGEIGEVGKKNSTVEEFEAFYAGYRDQIGDLKAISKISVQTGTAHGGVVLSDGSRRAVDIDFDVLCLISRAARRHGLAGTVQHGASTLPENLFDRFPRSEAVEIHLATEFQRLVFNHPSFPEDLRREMIDWLRKTKPQEWKENQTEAQNIEKSIKRCWGPFKKHIWSLDKNEILASLEQKLEILFRKLNVVDTRPLVSKHVTPVPILPPMPEELKRVIV